MIHKHFLFKIGGNRFAFDFDIDEQTGQPTNLQTNGLNEPDVNDDRYEYGLIYEADDEWNIDYNIDREEDMEWGTVGFRITVHKSGAVVFTLKGVDAEDEGLNVIDDDEAQDQYNQWIAIHLQEFM
jgi:hypothetical protein